MSWVYKITTGELTAPDGSFAGTGYSGKAGPFRNNPNATNVVGKGPIPVGSYAIGPPHVSPNTGPITMNLDPLAGTNTFGRSLFRIHGDNANHDASHGCVILGPSNRREIAGGDDMILTVVA